MSVVLPLRRGRPQWYSLPQSLRGSARRFSSLTGYTDSHIDD
jgi:hypothetical protein